MSLRNNIGMGVILCCIFMISSCAPRMVGTWTVEKLETMSPGQAGTSLTHIGTLTFDKDGMGSKNLHYKVFGRMRDDQIPFKWLWQDGQYMSIESEGSDFSKIWIIVVNKRKYQKWKSTDGTNSVQVLELRKQ